MTGPLFLYDSRLADAVPVASSTAAGFDVLNLRDLRDFTFWKPTALPATITVDCGSAKFVDSFAVYAHNLGSTGCTIEVRKSTDNFGANDVLVDTNTPTDDKPILRLIASQSSRYWRLRITTGALPTLAMAILGNRLEVPVIGPKESFDPLGRTIRSTQNRSVKGRALGQVLDARVWNQNVVFELVTWTWLRTVWQAAAELSLEVQPFLFAWNPDAYPKEVWHTIIDGQWNTPHRAGGYTDLTVPLAGVMP